MLTHQWLVLYIPEKIYIYLTFEVDVLRTVGIYFHTIFGGEIELSENDSVVILTS